MNNNQRKEDGVCADKGIPLLVMIMDMTESQMLKYAVENGIIDINTLQTKIEMNERKKYLEMHEHKIWKGTNGFWYTHVTDESKKDGRRLIKRKTKSEVQDEIIRCYKDKVNEPIVKDVFYGWIDQKMRFGEIQKQTYERYEADFKRYFVSGGMAERKIRYITECELEEFIKMTINQQGLSAKAWGNMRTLINGIYRYAKKKGYTNISITSFLGDVEISNRSFSKSRKTDAQCVFNDEEMRKLLEYLNAKPTIGNLGVLLAAYTGMRVGEIVSLKWEDIGEKSIYVHRTQIRYHDDEGNEVYAIRDSPKTDAGIRNVVIVDNLRPILKKLKSINPFSEYVFFKKGKVMTKHAIYMSLHYACEKIGIPQRSMHALRKTYATRLINSRVDDAIIINQMGHTDIETTKGYYYYNDKTFDAMSEMIGSAINY